MNSISMSFSANKDALCARGVHGLGQAGLRHIYA